MAARIILARFVFLPGAWYLVIVRGGSVQTLMPSFASYLALLAIALAFRFASGKWKSNDLVPEHGDFEQLVLRVRASR
jgi:hypothetical protein